MRERRRNCHARPCLHWDTASIIGLGCPSCWPGVGTILKKWKSLQPGGRRLEKGLSSFADRFPISGPPSEEFAIRSYTAPRACSLAYV